MSDQPGPLLTRNWLRGILLGAVVAAIGAQLYAAARIDGFTFALWLTAAAFGLMLGSLARQGPGHAQLYLTQLWLGVLRLATWPEADRQRWHAEAAVPFAAASKTLEELQGALRWLCASLELADDADDEAVAAALLERFDRTHSELLAEGELELRPSAELSAYLAIFRGRSATPRVEQVRQLLETSALEPALSYEHAAWILNQLVEA